MTPAPLRIRSLSVSLAGRGIAALDISVAPGEVAVLAGPSGAGKSTLLAAIAGTAAPVFAVSGEVWVGDERVDGLPPERRRIGLIMQDGVLFPHLSVAGNLAFGLTPAVRGRGERARRVEEALAAADLAGFGPRDPATLSGGQKARVALMRALLAEPRALLLDEPFAALDPDLRSRFRSFVLQEVRARSIPAILVTHDGEDAQAAGGPVVQLAPGR